MKPANQVSSEFQGNLILNSYFTLKFTVSCSALIAVIHFFSCNEYLKKTGLFSRETFKVMLKDLISEQKVGKSHVVSV